MDDPTFSQQENEKNYIQKKSPWRWLFLTGAILSGAYLAFRKFLLTFGRNLIGWTFHPGESASIGIIGGADGPTAVFITSAPGIDWDVIILLAVMVVCILAFLRLCRRK